MKTIRRLYFYLVTLVSLEVVAWALISLARSVFNQRLSDVLAGGLAFILVGLPVFLFHWRVVQREALADSEERFSGVRATFLYAAWISLAVPVVQNLLAMILRMFALLFDISPQAIAIGGSQNWADNLVAILVNAVLAAYFFSVLQKDWQANPLEEAFPIVRRLNRYFWVLYGLGMTYGGVVQLLQFIFERLRSASFRLEIVLVNALGMILVGVPLWLYSWRIVQQVGKSSQVRTAALYGLTLLGALASLLAAGNSLLIILRTLMSQVFTWGSAWGDLGTALSVLVPSAVVWGYHWRVLKADISESTSPVQQHSQRRLYFYLLSLAGLVATFFALQLLVTLLAEAFFCSPGGADHYGSCQRLVEVQLPNAIAILLISVPLWVLHWRPAQSRALLDNDLGENARSSLLRKVYLYLVLFAGVIGTMVTTGWLLYELISNLLGIEAPNSMETILTLIGTLVLFLIFTVYHWRLLRTDGRMLDETLAARHQKFPVVVISPNEAFSQQIGQGMAALAPHIPLIIQTAGQPLAAEIEEAKAAILPSDILTGADDPLQAWLNAFKGERLVLPTAVEGWVWLGVTEQSMERQVRQAVRVIQQLAEAGETKAARSLSPAAVIGYVFAGLLGMAALCILSSLLMEMFA